MKAYSDVKKEMESIAKLLEKFSEPVQPRAFEILVNSYFGQEGIPAATADQKLAPPNRSTSGKPAKNKTEKKASQRTKTTSKGSSSPTLLKNLNLNGDKDTLSFAEIVDEKAPKTNIQFNAVAVYYLKKLRNMDSVGPDHVYTCYKNVKRKTPKTFEAFIQSIYDTSSAKYGYIDAADMNDIHCPLTGETFVEHELPSGGKPKTNKSKTKK